VNSFPAHRGSRTSSVPTSHAPNAALLIDFDNVTLGVRSDLTKELRHLLSSDIIKGKVSVQRAYADWRRYPQYIVPLSESSIDLIFAPAFGTNKKNATDIRLAIDATELVFTRPEIGTYILLSGDSDFSSLVIKLKEYGKYVIGVGIRESASDILIQNCDEYFSYTDLAGLTKEEDTPSTQRDPWELLTEAVDKMVANRDVMRADRLKQVMQQIDQNFDEKNAGFNRFSKFMQEAATRGLVTLNKMENGQFEVAPAKGAATTGQAPAAPSRSRSRRGSASRSAPKDPVKEAVKVAEPAKDAEPEESKERGRRRRRGGRGRGREGAGERETTTAAAAPARNKPKDEGLTLAEAFHLLSRSLGELPAPVPHEALRGRMAALHGREDPLLEEAVFPRLLRQANDAEIADVRLLGEGQFEVSPHKADLAMQFRTAAETAADEAKSGVPTASPSRPAGARNFRSRRGSGARRSGEVAMVGVVNLGGDEAKATTAEKTEAKAAEPKKRSRKRTARKSPATKTDASTTAATKPAAKSPKATAKKAAKKSTKKAAVRKTAAKKVAVKKAAKKSTKKAAAKKTAKKAAAKPAS
jgi:uncharacterized protein (TIGR00288 family)